MTMFGSQWFANPGSTYEIEQSCRFNDDDAAHLHWTPGSAASDSQKLTVSVWAKRGNLGTNVVAGPNSLSSMVGAAASGIFIGFMRVASGSVVDGMRCGVTAGYQLFNTNRAFSDPGAWYHVVWQVDTTQSTALTRFTLWVNGVQQTAFIDTYDAPGSGGSLTKWAVQSIKQSVGTGGTGQGDLFDGYLAEVILIDGTAYSASDFGETNSTTGQWVPKDPSKSNLTFGNNGYWLDFADSSDLGNDVSGNDNDFTSSGLVAADQMPDTPTNNYATWNPLQKNTSITLSDGNLTGVGTGAQTTLAASTMIVPSGSKIYAEFAISGAATAMIGCMKENEWAANFDATAADSMRLLHLASGDVYSSDTTPISNYAPNDSVPVTIMVALDLENDNIYWGDAGTDKWSDGSGTYDQDWSGSPGAVSLTANLNWKFAGRFYGATVVANFGQSSFTGTKPTGYSILNTSSLSAPATTDPSAYFQNTLYTGDGASSLAVNQGGNSTFDPDLVWIKNRDATDAHCLFDSVRGATKLISSDSTAAETTDADTLLSFDSDGFSVGADVKVNTSSEKYVGWQWIEGATPGFDVVSFTGNATARTISHSVGVAPEFMLVKNLADTDNWAVYHASNTTAPATDYLILNTTAATADDATIWNDTAPTSSVFSVGTSSLTNGNTEAMIAYLWAGVEGFSKFGYYIGNADANGPFVWCGFRPAFLMVKQTSGAEGWIMFDKDRDPFNVSGDYLFADTTGAEYDSAYVDLLSNGFKARISGSGMNGSGTTHLFMAFAEAPFKTANAR